MRTIRSLLGSLIALVLVGGIASAIAALMAKRRLVSRVGDHALVQFLLTFVRFRRQDVAAESVIANHFPRARFLEAFGRAFVSFQLRHNNSPALYIHEK